MYFRLRLVLVYIVYSGECRDNYDVMLLSCALLLNVPNTSSAETNRYCMLQANYVTEAIEGDAAVSYNVLPWPEGCVPRGETGGRRAGCVQDNGRD